MEVTREQLEHYRPLNLNPTLANGEEDIHKVIDVVYSGLKLEPHNKSKTLNNLKVLILNLVINHHEDKFMFTGVHLNEKKYIANRYNKNQVELSEGVYSVKVLLNNKQFEGISNYGMRPTFNKKTPLLETHLFNFNKNIYGQEIKVKFVAKIRDEIKFNNVEDLLKQIPLDINKAKEILNNGN